MKQIHLSLFKWVIVIAILLVVTLAVFLGAWSYRGGFLSGAERITIGAMADMSTTLLSIASEGNFFRNNGLDVTIKTYELGLTAGDDLLKGELDLACMTEFLIAGMALQRKAVSIIASHDKAQNMYLVVRKDRGVATIADLKGKRVALARGAIGGFFLARSIERQGGNMGDLTLVDLPPSKAAEAFLTGKVDAVIVLHFVLEQIRQQMKNEIVIWPMQMDQPIYYVIAGKNDWLARHPELVKRLLNSLVQAEDYLLHHPGEAKAIVQKRLKVDDSFIAAAWPQHQFSITLDYALIAAMNDEARWMIRNNLTKDKEPPNFLDYISEAGLRAVKPGAVNIVR